MPLRVRKSVRLGKGVNLNFNKNSVGVSVSGKAGRVSVNSKGRTTTTVHTPIKGVSYVNTYSNKKQYKCSPWELTIICVFGWFGLHKFLKGEILLGLIYMFTFGLCGICWFYDICKGFKDCYF